MFITIFAWLYISFSCAIWGKIMLHSIQRILGREQVNSFHFSFICLLGLSGITVFASFLSLFIPVGGWLFQVILLLSTIIFFLLKTTGSFFAGLKKQLKSLHPVLIFLFCCCVVMLLVMSTWTINHPDTLAYHAQTIQWIEKYKAVPGIANLHIRYGYQGLWFVSCAIFSFRFINLDALTFINSTILVWYFFFIIQKIHENILPGKNKIVAFLWLVLAAISILSYTQVRLTATSASPDFIASLFVWSAFFLLLEKKTTDQQNIQWILIILFSSFAITLKLSVLPIMLTVLYAAYKLIQKKQIRSLVISCIIFILIFSSYLVRNVISSGYPLFPSPYPDIVNVDWKVDKTETKLERDYIKAYARSPVDHTEEKIRNKLTMKFNEWIPVWWTNQSVADKISILLAVLAFVLLLINIKMIANSGENIKCALVISIAGCIFWFTQAPDPRFGFGFIISFPAIVMSMVLPRFLKTGKLLPKKILIVCSLIFSLIIAAYNFYRFKNFFTFQQIVQPLGITKIPFKTIQCNGIDFRIPLQNGACGTTGIPCVYDDCKEFMPRGNKIVDGFKGRNH
ncbi:MAG: LIC_10190 family membrane protein [Chitinophagales bacterium]